MANDHGIIVREHRGFFEVETESGSYLCTLRSKLRKSLLYPESTNRHQSVASVRRIKAISPVAIGDQVRIVESDQDTGVIEEVFSRRTKLSRAAPGRRPVEQVMIANADQLLIVFAMTNPVPNLRLLDRILVAAGVGRLESVICFNKMDLTDDDSRDLSLIYEKVGYRVIKASAANGRGVGELRQVLIGKLSAIAGPSGVGKTTLLNLLQPGLGLKVREVSEITGKGRHTTTYLAAHKLDAGGMVIDMPGIRELSLWEVESEELAGWFPEMIPYLDSCKYQDCAHVTEPRCAIKAALAEGVIGSDRYESYVHLRAELVGRERAEN